MPTRNEKTLVPVTAVVSRTTHLKLQEHLAPWVKNMKSTDRGKELSDRVIDAMCFGQLVAAMVEMLDQGQFDLAIDTEVGDDV